MTDITFDDTCKMISSDDPVEDFAWVEVSLEIKELVMKMLAARELENQKQANQLREDLFRPGHFEFTFDVNKRILEIPRRNSIEDVIEFFSVEKKRVGHVEFFEFWDSISVAERLFYLLVPLR